MPSFHVLITSIGRPSLQRMVDSLLTQLHECDHLTIVYDGVKEVPVLRTEGLAQIHVHHQTPNLGAWGHGIRNKYAKKLERTDFIMHGDDDDMYLEGAFEKLRGVCANTDTLYIAKLGNDSPPLTYIKTREIGTPNGIIPYDLNSLGYWMMCLGGDGMFYETIEEKAKSIEFLDIAIYKVR